MTLTKRLDEIFGLNPLRSLFYNELNILLENFTPEEAQWAIQRLFTIQKDQAEAEGLSFAELPKVDLDNDAIINAFVLAIQESPDNEDINFEEIQDALTKAIWLIWSKTGRLSNQQRFKEVPSLDEIQVAAYKIYNLLGKKGKIPPIGGVEYAPKRKISIDRSNQERL